MKKSRMTVVEKARMKLSIMTALEKEMRKCEPVVSPYAVRTPYYFRFSFKSVSVGRMVSVVAFSFVFILGGLSFASADSLPGDILYPIKINITESIEEQLTFTPEKKIALRQKRIEDRFMEVEKLIKEKRITPENLSIAQSEIQIEKEKIKEDIEEINKANPEVAVEAKIELEDTINKRQETIDIQIEEDKEIKSIEVDLANFETNLLNATNIEEVVEVKEEQKKEADIEAKSEVKEETKNEEATPLPATENKEAEEETNKSLDIPILPII